MKENGMNKLLELLNEYNKEIGKPKRMSEREVRTHYGWVICSGYGFIKWLVENDKIDRHSKNLELDMKRMRIPQDYYIGGLQSLTLQHKKEKCLCLIALLSIQNEPIEFLISVLK